MAISVVEVLERFGSIDQDALALAFARRFTEDPMRGYGGTAQGILRDIQSGVPWPIAAGRAFGGGGSCGNGSAMRVAPLGGWFADDLPKAPQQAALSASPTHTHPEAAAGAIAIAVAAAVAWQMGNRCRATDPRAMFDEVLRYTPEGEVRAKLQQAAVLDSSPVASMAAQQLGNGGRLLCQDTVPFCVWVAAHHLASFEDAIWTAIPVGGDIDTNCAIIGGIVALYTGTAGIPLSWRKATEAV